MALNADETVVGARGDVYVAPVGTAFPADPDAAPAVAWVHLGYISDDGASFSPDQNVEEFTAWQSLSPIRRARTSLAFSMSFTLLQLNPDTLPLALGGGTITADTPVGFDTYEPPDPEDLYERAVLLRVLDGTRTYDLRIKRALPTDLGETQFAKGAMASLPVTLGVLVPADASKPYSLILPAAA